MQRRSITKNLDNVFFIRYNGFTESVKEGKMMKKKYSEKQYIQMTEQRLRSILNMIPIIKSVNLSELVDNNYGDLNCMVHFHKNQKPVVLQIEVKSRGERRFAEQFAENVKQYKNAGHFIFAAPYISEGTAAFLKSKQLSYMDLSGNCCLAMESFFVFIEGKPNQFKFYQNDKNYFSRKASVASTILRTLLNAYQKNWKVQSLSDETGASLGTVSNVRKFLIEHGWAEAVKDGFRICQIQELVTAWAKEYNKEKNHTFSYYSLDSIPNLEQQIQQWNDKNNKQAALGLFAAAVRYAPMVRYNKLYIYVESEDVEQFVHDMGLKEVSSGDNVRLIVPHDNTPLLYTRKINNNIITSPVQTVLDLLSGIGRGEEAASAVLEKEFLE